MKVYRKDSGKRFVPQGHANITARVVFNAENGCLKASILLSTLPRGSGMDEEVHEHSDQIFYDLQGHVNAFSNKEQIATLSEGCYSRLLENPTFQIRKNKAAAGRDRTSCRQNPLGNLTDC
jgi:hypothetical protein